MIDYSIVSRHPVFGFPDIQDIWKQTDKLHTRRPKSWLRYKWVKDKVALVCQRLGLPAEDVMISRPPNYFFSPHIAYLYVGWLLGEDEAVRFYKHYLITPAEPEYREFNKDRSLAASSSNLKRYATPEILSLVPNSFEGISFQTYGTAEKPFWYADDVARALGLTHQRDMLRYLEEDEKGTVLTHTPGGPQQKTIVYEPGLYTCILRARAATTKGTLAYKFRRWVTHEVLPSIRMYGSYRNNIRKNYIDVNNLFANSPSHPNALLLHDLASKIQADDKEGLQALFELAKRLMPGNDELFDSMLPKVRQAKNPTRVGEAITWEGRTQTIPEWAREMGMTDCNLRIRIRNWGLERAMSTPKEERFDRTKAS